MNLLTRWFLSFLPSRQPWITRQSYSREIVTSMTFPVAVAMIESGVVGILAEKTFEVSKISPLLFATITAAPIFANLTSFFWARMAKGRRKVPFIVGLQIAVLIMCIAIAFLPVTSMGGILLTLLILLIRCMLAGTVTLRSILWRHNYPRLVRASVTGRLTIMNSIVMGIAPMLAFAFLDFSPDAFRYIYPLSAIIAVFGTRSLSRVRLRHERELLDYERQPKVKPQPRGTPATIYEYDPNETTATFWSVLKKDVFFRRYMIYQFFGGGANMMGEIVLIYFVAEITRKQMVRAEYFTSILLTTSIPLLVAVILLPYWARMLDRMHITEFRSRHAIFWLLDQLFNFVGVMLGSLWVIAVGRVVQGVVRAGGMLAWNLGHNDFAGRRLVSLYMGIHVTLTGVRGVLFPFVGMFLVLGVSGEGWLSRQAQAVLGDFQGIGAYIFLVTSAMTIYANVGYHRMARQLKGRARIAD